MLLPPDENPVAGRAAIQVSRAGEVSEGGEQHGEHDGVTCRKVGEHDDQPSCCRMRAPRRVRVNAHRKRAAHQYLESRGRVILG